MDRFSLPRITFCLSYLIGLLVIKYAVPGGDLYPLFTWDLFSGLKHQVPFTDILLRKRDGTLDWISHGSTVPIRRWEFWPLAQHAGEELLTTDCDVTLASASVKAMRDHLQPFLGELERVELHLIHTEFATYMWRPDVNPRREFCAVIYAR